MTGSIALSYWSGRKTIQTLLSRLRHKEKRPSYTLLERRVPSERGFRAVLDGIDTIQFAALKLGATGGDKIQNVINDLPARGGLVFIGANGSDSVANNNGEVEDNVWEVTSEINTNAKNAVWIQGASPGWKGLNSGTTLMCSDSSVKTMLHYEDGGFLDGLMNIRVDGDLTPITACNSGGR
jgi:hypothetical protein